YMEGPDGKRVKEEGLLEEFELSAEEALYLIMRARLAVGMIDEAEFEAATTPAPAPEGEDEDTEGGLPEDGPLSAEDVFRTQPAG
ncbi:MAG: hypothetical protein AAFZ09_12005, partial [Pseudomonadota bacterium]